jgi:transposase-like protein
MRKTKGRAPIHSQAFKIAVVREYLDSSLTVRELAEKHGLPNHQTVLYFIRWYKKAYPDGSAASQVSPALVLPTADNNALYRELQDARLEIMALQTMIAIAGEELGIDIPKKAGTKQSKS